MSDYTEETLDLFHPFPEEPNSMSAYCIQCKKEMFCDKIGVFAAFQERHHCYAGDVYKCPQCLSSVLIVSPETKPTYIEHPEKVQKELFIDIQE